MVNVLARSQFRRIRTYTSPETMAFQTLFVVSSNLTGDVLGLQSAAANDTDHARIRRLLSHAFSEAALREQEPLLNSYFDLLVNKLYSRSQEPDS